MRSVCEGHRHIQFYIRKKYLKGHPATILGGFPKLKQPVHVMGSKSRATWGCRSRCANTTDYELRITSYCYPAIQYIKLVQTQQVQVKSYLRLFIVFDILSFSSEYFVISQHCQLAPWGALRDPSFCFPHPQLRYLD